MSVFDHFENATFDLKSRYTDILKEMSRPVSALLEHIFSILDVGLLSSVPPFDLSKWEFQYIEVEGKLISPLAFFYLMSFVSRIG
jgi:hypothetical protein